MKGHKNCSGQRGWCVLVFCRKNLICQPGWGCPCMEEIHLKEGILYSIVYCRSSVRKLRNPSESLQFCRQQSVCSCWEGLCRWWLVRAVFSTSATLFSANSTTSGDPIVPLVSCWPLNSSFSCGDKRMLGIGWWKQICLGGRRCVCLGSEVWW